MLVVGMPPEKALIMKKHVVAAASILSLAAAGAVFASDIYKWIDDEGNVHYGDRPVGAEPERLAIASRPTDPARIQMQAEARAEARARAAEEKAAEQAGGPSPEEEKAAADERAAKCATLREQMQRFVTSRRIYREDEAGERVYLDEEEMQATRQRTEEQLVKYCD